MSRLGECHEIYNYSVTTLPVGTASSNNRENMGGKRCRNFCGSVSESGMLRILAGCQCTMTRTRMCDDVFPKCHY